VDCSDAPQWYAFVKGIRQRLGDALREGEGGLEWYAVKKTRLPATRIHHTLIERYN
jgi:hypothetical protein